MLAFVWASRAGLFADGRFMGKVLDEWIGDAQEFLHTKLPRLLMAALIAFLLYRLLSIITARMIRIAEAHAAAHSRIAQVRTMAGVIRATGLTIIAAIVIMQFLAAIGVNLAPLLASAGVAGITVLRPGTCINMACRACECWAPCSPPRLITARITRGTLDCPANRYDQLAA